MGSAGGCSRSLRYAEWAEIAESVSTVGAQLEGVESLESSDGVSLERSFLA